MNILFLSDIVPYPPNTGIKIRTFNIIKQLAKAYTVYLLAFNHRIMINDEEEMNRCVNALNEYCKEVHVFDIPSDKNKIAYLYLLGKNIFQIAPYRVKRYYSRSCKQKIVEIIKNKGVDLIHLDKTEFFGYAPLFKGMPTVATNHNIESDLMRQRCSHEVNLPRKFFAFLQYLKTRRFEKTALSKVSAYITCTDRDRDFFREHLGIQTLHETIYNGVDTSHYRPSGFQEEHYVLIIGAQNKESTANYDATMFFMKEIWPQVAEQAPELTIKIVGRNPDHSVLDLEKKYNNVEVCGFIEDEREVLGKAKALLVPLRVGGGSRLKILTAMAMGKSVISTSKGAEGILYENRKDIIIADDPRNFSQEVLNVVQNSKLRRSIGYKAHKLVCKYYDWDSIGKRLRNFYDSIAKDE